MEEQHPAEEHEGEEADGDDERHGRCREARLREVERLRQQVEERDSENRPRAEAEDQVQLVLVAEREPAAEQCRAEGGESEEEGHREPLCRAEASYCK